MLQTPPPPIYWFSRLEITDDTQIYIFLGGRPNKCSSGGHFFNIPTTPRFLADLPALSSAWFSQEIGPS